MIAFDASLVRSLSAVFSYGRMACALFVNCVLCAPMELYEDKWCYWHEHLMLYALVYHSVGVCTCALVWCGVDTCMSGERLAVCVFLMV